MSDLLPLVGRGRTRVGRGDTSGERRTRVVRANTSGERLMRVGRGELECEWEEVECEWEEHECEWEETVCERGGVNRARCLRVSVVTRLAMVDKHTDILTTVFLLIKV